MVKVNRILGRVSMRCA